MEVPQNYEIISVHIVVKLDRKVVVEMTPIDIVVKENTHDIAHFESDFGVDKRQNFEELVYC